VNEVPTVKDVGVGTGRVATSIARPIMCPESTYRHLEVDLLSHAPKVQQRGLQEVYLLGASPAERSPR